MPGKSLKKFCRISQWIEQADEPLALAIRALCMERGLYPRRDGVTFLFPTAKVRKQIVGSYASDPATAERLINAHMLHKAVLQPSDFEGGVGSKLGILVEAESIDAKGVTLVGGAKLRPAPDFEPLRGNRIAVWLVESGEVPLEGKAWSPTRASRGESAVLGGGGGGGGQRASIGFKVAAEYDACMRAGGAGPDPFLTAAVSLLNFLKLDYPELFKAVLPLIDRDPCTTFFLLAEPFAQGSSCVLPDSVLLGPKGWNCARIYRQPVAEFRAFLEAACADESAFIGRPPAVLRAAIDRVRLQIVGVDGRAVSAVRTPRAVREVYAQLVGQNTIDGVGPVFPPETLRLVPGAKKIWQDELRFVLHCAMSALRARPYDPSSFRSILLMLQHDRPGTDPSSEASLSSAEQLLKNVSPKDEFNLLLRFVCSSDFLHVPVPAAHIGSSWGEVPASSEPGLLRDTRDLSVYNAEASKQRLLEGYAGAGHDAAAALDAGHAAQLRFHSQQ